MVLPVLDYCDVVIVVWHECGQGNSNEIEQLQRRGSRIVYFNAGSELSTDDILIKLGWDPSYNRRESQVHKLVKDCIDNRAPVYLSDYFKIKHQNLCGYNIRNSGNAVLDRIKLQ